MTLDKTLVLAGAKPKRVRLRVVGTAVEQTTYTARGTPKITTKSYAAPHEAEIEFGKAVRKRLRDDYALVNPGAAPGEVLLEAFAPGGGGGQVLDLSPDGTLAVTASITSEREFGAKLEIVEVATGARHVVLDEPGGSTQNFLHTALFDRDAQSIYVLLRDDTFRLDLATKTRTTLAEGRDTGVNPHVVRPSFDADRNRLVVFAKGPCVRVLDDKQRTLLEVSTKSAMTECRDARLSPSGRLLAVYNASRGIIYNHEDARSDTTNEVQIWDVEAGALWETVTIAEKVHHVGFTPEDDRLLVTYDYARGPVALEIPSGRELWRMTDPQRTDALHRTEAWTYSRDGSRLALAGRGVQLLDAATREPVLDLPSSYARGACPVFSRDGRRLAVSLGGTMVVYAI